MFGMKRQDADALLEDVVRLGQAGRRRVQQDEYVGPSAADLQRDKPLHEARSENVRLAAKHLKVSTALEVTQKNLADMSEARSQTAYSLNDVNAMAGAAMKALDATMAGLAKATGRSIEDVKREAYAIMRNEYDRKIGELLSTSVLISDPRQDPEIK
ncbi:MAG: hypothetical protein VB141_12970, partial [Burkholderia gladioli]